jgi:hypothetical protein
MLENLPKPRDSRLCIVARKSSELNQEDFDILQEALANPAWSNNGLADALTKEGFQITENSLRKHRKKLCACAR